MNNQFTYNFYADDWDENSYKKIKEKNILYLKTIFQNSLSKQVHTIIIIDDLMYLRSMRKEMYVLNRDYNKFIKPYAEEINTDSNDDVIKDLDKDMKKNAQIDKDIINTSTFLNIHIKTNLSTALERNSLRNIPDIISHETIYKIFENFEEFNINYVHERNNIVICSDTLERYISFIPFFHSKILYQYNTNLVILILFKYFCSN